LQSHHSFQNTEKELQDVYSPAVAQNNPQVTINSSQRELRLVDALAEGMKQAMEKHENLILMGQDIAGVRWCVQGN
jgi:2-oxoisovalerate dehydrogenase E1 component